MSAPSPAKEFKLKFVTGEPITVKVRKGVTFTMRWREVSTGWRGSIAMTNQTKKSVYPIRYKMKLVNKAGKVLGQKDWRRMELPQNVSSNTEARIKREADGEPARLVLDIQGAGKADRKTGPDLEVLRVEVWNRGNGDWRCRAVIKNSGDGRSKACEVVVVTEAGKTVFRGDLKALSPNGSTSVWFETRPATVTVTIDPHQKFRDLNRRNNEMTKTLK